MPTSENYGPLLPISFYGASKLASEGLITSFCHNFNFEAWIYRFGNIVGKNSTHGAILDFLKKLKNNPKELEVLGNGKQAKPYLHVDDCIDGMLFGFLKSKKQINFFNLACPEATKVSEIAKIVLDKTNLKDTKINYTGGKRGWKGDVAQVRLASFKLKKLGWKAKLSSTRAVEKAVGELAEQFYFSLESDNLNNHKEK
jgi:UDP-glucose 4-epimerase